MKKIISIAVVVLMLVSMLAACSNNDESGKTNTPQGSGGSSASSVVLSDLLSKINTDYDISAETVSGLKILEKAEDLDRYYAISTADVKQFAAEKTSSSQTYTEIVLVEATDSAAAGRVLAQLNSRLDSQRNDAQSYSPESLDMLNKCSVLQKGNFVYLVISADFDAIVKVIEAAI